MLSRITNAILSGSINNIVVLTGAGISCSTGIPDFRSSGGLYDTLKPDLITATPQQRNEMRSNPTAVVDIDLFSQNPFPYLEVRRPFILGTQLKKWKPTLGHFFIKVLADKGKLRRLYSQVLPPVRTSLLSLVPCFSTHVSPRLPLHTHCHS